MKEKIPLPEKFKSFQEAGLALKEREGKKLRERFQEAVMKRINQIPPGCNFYSELPGVESITVIKSPNNNGVFTTVFYKNPEKKASLLQKTFSVFADGTFSGQMPKKFNASREELFKSIIDGLDRIGLDFWHNQPQKILEKKDWPMPPKNKEEKECPGRIIRADPRRIEFLRKQPDALFGFYGDNGLAGYQGFVFNKFIVLENPECENAAFFIDFSTAVNEDEQKKSSTLSGRNEILEKYWKPYVGMGKFELFGQKTTERIIHKPIDAWIPQIAEKLNERNPLPNREEALTEQQLEA